jgi:hypothetical protein
VTPPWWDRALVVAVYVAIWTAIIRSAANL